MFNFSFWSSVDLTGNQTRQVSLDHMYLFWSSVDLTGNQTSAALGPHPLEFWSSVDLTGNQTYIRPIRYIDSFGAVPI